MTQEGHSDCLDQKFDRIMTFRLLPDLYMSIPTRVSMQGEKQNCQGILLQLQPCKLF